MNHQQHPRIFAALVTVFFVAACGQRFEPDSPEHVVQSLYKAAAITGIPKDEATLSRYFDGRLTQLLVRDFNCVTHDRPCGLLYFDPVAQSSKPAITELELFKPEDEHEVFVRFEQNGAEYRAVCVMVKTAAGWRVSDIIYYGANQVLEPGASLMTHLMMQTELPPPWHPEVPGMAPEELEQLHL